MGPASVIRVTFLSSITEKSRIDRHLLAPWRKRSALYDHVLGAGEFLDTRTAGVVIKVRVADQENLDVAKAEPEALNTARICDTDSSSPALIKRCPRGVVTR